MFRMWGKLIKDNHLLKDITACRSDYSQSRTQMVFLTVWMRSAMNLTWKIPFWLDSTITDFKRHSKTRFYQDSFIEQIEFDYLEIQVIEED